MALFEDTLLGRQLLISRDEFANIVESLLQLQFQLRVIFSL